MMTMPDDSYFGNDETVNAQDEQPETTAPENGGSSSDAGWATPGSGLPPVSNSAPRRGAAMADYLARTASMNMPQPAPYHEALTEDTLRSWAGGPSGVIGWSDPALMPAHVPSPNQGPIDHPLNGEAAAYNAKVVQAQQRQRISSLNGIGYTDRQGGLAS